MISTLVVLLATCNLLVSRVSSLKLTPVQRTKHRLDIHEECEKFLSAVQNAHNKVLEDEMNVIDQRVTLDSDELKKLRLLVNRWNSIDDKLRDINALSATQNKNPIYEDIHYYLATSKVIIGKLLVKSDTLDPLLHELKDSCMSVWKYTSTYRSLETYSWLDCYSVLYDMAKSAPSGEEVIEIASQLRMSLPWLPDVLQLEGTDCSHQQCDATTYLHEFRNLSSVDKTILGTKLRYAWAQMYQLRLQLHSIVEGFLFASLEGSGRLQRSLYADAQKVIEDMNIALYQDADKDLLTPLPVPSSIDRKSLRSVLVDQINDEYSRYLSVMRGILEDGSKYLDDISSGHHVDLTHRPTIGFKSKLEVIEFFYKIIVAIQSKEIDSHRQYGSAAQLKSDHEASKGTSKKTATRRREVPASKKRSHRAEQEKAKEATADTSSPESTSSMGEGGAYSEYLSAVTSCMQYLLMLVALYAATAMCGGHYLRALKAKAASSKPANKRHAAPSGIPTIHCAVSVSSNRSDLYPDNSRTDHPEPSRCMRNVTGTHLARSILAIQLFVETQQSNMSLFNREVAIRGAEQSRLLAKLLGHYLRSCYSYCSRLLDCNNSRSVNDAAQLAEDFLLKPTGSSPSPWMNSFTADASAAAATDLSDNTRPAAAASKKAQQQQQSKLKNRGKTQLKQNKSSASRPSESSDAMKAPAVEEEKDRSTAVPLSSAAVSELSGGGSAADASLDEAVGVLDHSGTVESMDRSDKKAVEGLGCTSDESWMSSSIYRDDGAHPVDDDDDGGWISIRSSANSQRPQRAHRPAVTYIRLQTRRPVRKMDSSVDTAPSYSSRATMPHPPVECPQINHTSIQPIDRNRSPKTFSRKEAAELDGSSSGAGVAVDASLHCSDSTHVKDNSRGMRSNRTASTPRHNSYVPHKSLVKYHNNNNNSNSSTSKKVLNSFSRPADIVSYRQSSVPIALSSSGKGDEQQPAVVVVCATESDGSASPDPAGQLEDADPAEHSSLSDNASETTSHEDCSTLHTQQQQLLSATQSPDSVFTFPRLPTQSDHAQPSMPFYSVPVQQQQQQQQAYPQQMSYSQGGYPMMPTMGMPYPSVPVSYTMQQQQPTPHAPSLAAPGDLPTNESAPVSSSYPQPASSALTIQLPPADSYAYPSPHFSPAHYYSPTMYPPGSYYPSNFVFASRTPSPNQQSMVVGSGDENELIGAVRMQIEYYFSPQNLMHDVYLRRTMDRYGFVQLRTIAQFPRMLKLGASAYQIMTAVQQSSLLDISGSDSVLRAAAKNNFYEIQTLSVADIMSTKVRAIDNPTSWVLQQSNIIDTTLPTPPPAV